MNKNQMSKDNQIEEINISKGPKEISKDKVNTRQLVRTSNIIEKSSMEQRLIELQDEVIQNRNSNPMNSLDVLKEYHKYLNSLLENPRIKMFYNNKFHIRKMNNIKDYEQIINDCYPPLEWLVVSRVGTQFLSVHHKAGTEIIMKYFMPYYDYSIEYLRNNRNEITASEMTLINQNFPFYRLKYSSAVGKVGNIGGGEQGYMTYASKYTNSFGFLRTINYTNSEQNELNLKNLIDVVNKLKLTLYGVDPEYKSIFNYCIDSIAHFYISKATAPNSEFFTLERLLKYFNMDKLKSYNIFYNDNDLKENPDLILDEDIETGMEMEIINTINEDESLLIKDDIQEQLYYKSGNEFKKIGVDEQIDAGKRHLIPRDYITVRNKLYGIIEILIKSRKLPAPVDISTNIANEIKQIIKNKGNSGTKKKDGW